jgi:transposase
MQSSSSRRVHSAELKARVLAACQQPGASVAAVALAHELNANLVRKWLIGRGLKRSGLVAPRPAVRTAREDVAPASAPMQFVPLALARAQTAPATSTPSADAAECADDIRIELHWGGTQLLVQWPGGRAASCVAWLSELAATALKR